MYKFGEVRRYEAVAFGLEVLFIEPGRKATGKRYADINPAANCFQKLAAVRMVESRLPVCFDDTVQMTPRLEEGTTIPFWQGLEPFGRP